MIPNKKVQFVWTYDDFNMYDDLYRLITLVNEGILNSSHVYDYEGPWYLYATTDNIFNHIVGMINNPCWQKLVGVENE